MPGHSGTKPNEFRCLYHNEGSIMAHLDEETSNALFDTLAEWNQVLNAEALKGDTEPRP